MDGAPPPEEDFSQLSISERLAHKNWKARVNGYEALVKVFQATTSDNDPAFRPYTSNPETLRKIVIDTNAVAQEKGVETVIAYVKFAGETAARTRDAVIPALVDKCLGSTRAGTKTKAIELILEYVEVETGAAGIVEDILPGLNAKQPKAVAGSVTALKEIIRLYGPVVCPPKSIFKAIPKIFAHSDKTVRAEGQLLVQSLYSYVGDAIQPAIAELKPVQVKEINEACDALKTEGKGPGSVKPERLTRAAAREKEAQELAGGGDEGDTPAEDEAPDPLQFMSEVDVVKKFPEGLYTNLASSKWKDRKTALDDLAAVLTPLQKIQDAPAEFGELTRALAGRMGDANIMCVIAACQCLEGLAKGLGAPFARYREVVVTPMLERLKERKQNVQDAIGNALDAVFYTVAFPDIIPDITPQLSSKNPQVKEGSVKFLHRCMSTTKVPPTAPQIKGLSEGLAGLLDDGAEPVRNEAAQALGVLMKIVGERAMNAVMEKLDDIRKVKVKDSFDKAVVKCKVGSGGPPPRAAAKAPEPPKKKAPASKAKPGQSATDAAEDGPPPKTGAKPPTRPLTKKPPGAAASTSAPASKKPAPAAAAATKGKAPAPAAATDTFKFKHTPEDAEGRITELIPDSIQTDLGDANWKTRLAALGELTTWLEDGVVDDVDSELVVRFLMKKGASEKNFQVSTNLYGVLQLLAERSSTFGKPSAALTIGHLVEKLGDMKLKKPAGDAMLVFAEKTSLNFVLGQAYEPLSKQKAPKVLADATTWMKDALTEFGIAGLSLRPLIEHLKAALKNSNAAVRTSGTNCLVTLKIFAGAVVKDFLDDLNSQLMQTIEKEFEKVEGQAAPMPTRTQADVSSVPQTNGKGKAGGDPMEDLYPRVDIDRLLVGTPILANAKSDAWKSRKEALEQFQGLLEANRRFKPTMGDISQVLKARIPDTNKAVQTLALDVIARIAAGMNKPFEKYTRLYTVPIATVLADQKAPIRASAKATLTAIAMACEGPESLVSGLASALEAPNPLQRSELLSWLSEWFKDHPPPPALDLSAFVGPVIACLDDKSGDVRKGAQSALPFLMPSVGYDALVKETNNLKPASRSTVLPILQALKAANPASTSALEGRARPESVAPPESEPERAGSRVAPKSKLGLGLKRPAASAPPPAAAPTPVFRASPSGAPAPFTTSNPDAKRNRFAKDVGRWTIESGPVRKDLADFLQTQMEPHASRDILLSLFSHDHNAVNDWVTGMTVIADCYNHTLAGDERYGPTNEGMRAILVANSDLALKYSCLRVHENQSNLVSKALDLVEAVVALLAEENYRLADTEAACFLPTFIHKLGDAREPVRVRVQQLLQGLPKIYASSRIVQTLLEHGIRSKNAKTRQGTLDELAHVLKRTGLSACEPAKAFPIVASLIGDKDAAVRKSALGVLSEAYALEGDKIWSHVGVLSPKDKSQLEERLKRVLGPDKVPDSPLAAPPRSAIGRLSMGGTRSISPAPVSASRLATSMSPPRAASPALSQTSRTTSPAPSSGSGPVSRLAGPSTIGIGRPKSMLPSRLGPARGRPTSIAQRPTPVTSHAEYEERPQQYGTNGHSTTPSTSYPIGTAEDVTLIISNILSNDPGRSVDALKKVQKIMETTPDNGKADPKYQDLAEHTEGLIETVTLQMSHVFEHPNDILDPANFRLAKHLIQTLNAFCDHPLFVQSLPVDIITSLLEELTLRLLVTDDSTDPKVKDLSKFINMILLRIFATGRRISIFRALFLLLLRIVKPFPVNGTTTESREAKAAELVLKCIWKLARNIPDDLKSQALDPTELFPAIEQFLQSIPPNDWRARATNKVPSGDMPLRTIKVIIQHVVAEFREDVYDQLSTAFDDPSATIVYPYVYRILNARPREDTAGHEPTNGRHTPPSDSRPQSIASSSHVANGQRDSIASRPLSQRSATPPMADLDDQLNTIWMRVSEDSSGHKDALNDLYAFMKVHPEMKLKVEAMIEGTGGVFVRYIKRALASRQAEDELRSGVSRTSSTRTAPAPLVHRSTASSVATSGAQTPTSPHKSMALDESETAARIRALQDKFNYQGRSSIGSTIPGTPTGLGHAHTDSRSSRASSIYDVQSPEVQAHLRALRKRDSMG